MVVKEQGKGASQNLHFSSGASVGLGRANAEFHAEGEPACEYSRPANSFAKQLPGTLYQISEHYLIAM